MGQKSQIERVQLLKDDSTIDARIREKLQFWVETDKQRRFCNGKLFTFRCYCYNYIIECFLELGEFVFRESIYHWDLEKGTICHSADALYIILSQDKKQFYHYWDDTTAWWMNGSSATAGSISQPLSLKQWCIILSYLVEIIYTNWR